MIFLFLLGAIQGQESSDQCSIEEAKKGIKNTLGSSDSKVGCVFPMVIVSTVHHMEFGPNDHQEYASHFKTIHFSNPQKRVDCFPNSRVNENECVEVGCCWKGIVF